MLKPKTLEINRKELWIWVRPLWKDIQEMNLKNKLRKSRGLLLSNPLLFQIIIKENWLAWINLGVCSLNLTILLTLLQLHLIHLNAFRQMEKLIDLLIKYIQLEIVLNSHHYLSQTKTFKNQHLVHQFIN